MSYAHLTADLDALTGPEVRARLLDAKAAVAEVLARPDLPDLQRERLAADYGVLTAELLDQAKHHLLGLSVVLATAEEPVDLTPRVFEVPPGTTVDETLAVLDEIAAETGPSPAPPRERRQVPPIRRVPAPPTPEPERDTRPVPVAYASTATGDPTALRPWDDEDDKIPF